MADQPAPTIGRIVHYQSLGTPGGEFLSAPMAALVVGVGYADDDCVDLCVFYPNGWSNKTGIRRTDDPTPGCWNWPPRV